MATKTPIRLLFQETLRECFKVPETKVRKFNDSITQANNARDTENLEAFPNQYDKAEELRIDAKLITNLEKNAFIQYNKFKEDKW